MKIEEIAIAHAGTAAGVIPRREPLVSTLTIDGAEVLYLDRGLLENPAQKVCGGVPLLFRFAGESEGDFLVVSNAKIKRHGFARDAPWEIVERQYAMLWVAFAADDDTLTVFPFRFDAEQTVFISPGGSHVELLVRNVGFKPLPISPGWRPYFRCPGRGKSQFCTDIVGFPVSRIQRQSAFDFEFHAPPTGRRSFTLGGNCVSIAFSPEMRHLQFWSQAERDFLCVEPFLGPNNTIDLAARAEIAPGQCWALWLRIDPAAALPPKNCC